MRNKLRLKRGDKVIVIAGKDKGKIGEILRVYRDSRRVLVDGVNLVTKHKKKNTETQEGGIVKIEATMDISNVMYYCEAVQKGSKIGYKIREDGMKVRFCKKTGEEIEEKPVER